MAGAPNPKLQGGFILGSKAVGIYVIVCGILLGLVAALAIGVTVSEVPNDPPGDGTIAFMAFLAFVGASGTTIGIGYLVMLGGRILEAVRR